MHPSRQVCIRWKRGSIRTRVPVERTGRVAKYLGSLLLGLDDPTLPKSLEVSGTNGYEGRPVEQYAYPRLLSVASRSHSKCPPDLVRLLPGRLSCRILPEVWKVVVDVARGLQRSY